MRLGGGEGGGVSQGWSSFCLQAVPMPSGPMDLIAKVVVVRDIILSLLI